MGLPDVVYLVRKGDQNEELRHSLRSLKNLPHRRVWLAGFQPSWTTNVGRIKVKQGPKKWTNQEANIRAACEHPDVSDPFVMFNDDFFVIQPVDEVPVLHRGPLENVAGKYRSRSGEYSNRLAATLEYVGEGALSYDSIHVPMTVYKDRLIQVLDDIPDGVLFRTVYGNRFNVGGTRTKDAKIARTNNVPDGVFVSTSDRSFRSKPVGRFVRKKFRTPCSYET